MSVPSAPPNKRPRVEEEKSSVVTRSDIWHPDGSVVLQVGLTQFRVHSSVLSMHSPIFKDMFEMSKPDSTDPGSMVDGCPVVQLYDDPKDVENVLRALYTQTLLLRPQLEFPFVAALIRLGRKYVMEELWEAGVNILTTEFPDTLAGYNARSVVQFRPIRIKWYPALQIDCLDLAKETRVLTVLPCLYYNLLAQIKVTALLSRGPR
ncbi:BTB domain-containing protein [Mycena indigotica]|uniref:BTB domain-containing protein n=1 Tax=Mycena indigotica TaxID=2126181 RepID=A0A8H6WHK1_9AGAR|nr:BTB domain-containing protein [Mycena indigotica]KAF7315168.1 BTB domain-containing protein [Mycena indigotica]